jgi:hypothetical protein
MPANWRNAPFKDFTIQCSHNTFMHGTQKSNTVDPSAVQNALNMGYRCIEIDTYQEKYDGKTQPVVHHDGPFHSTNRVPFPEFTRRIKSWCEDDEKVHPSSERLPLVINLQNGAKTWGSRRRDYSTAVAKSFEDDLGDRIIKPEHFGVDTPMKDLVSNGKRKVIIRATRLVEDEALSDYVAIRKEKRHGTHGAATKSLAVGFNNKNMLGGHQGYMPSDTNLKDIGKNMKSGKLVRMYPLWSHTSSVNFKPYYLFAKRAHMVCVNWQGRCPDDNHGCPGPFNGVASDDVTVGNYNCKCKRRVGAGVEQAFEEFGYDGYIHYDSLGQEGWDKLKAISNFNYSDEYDYANSGRRRLAVDGSTDVSGK